MLLPHASLSLIVGLAAAEFGPPFDDALELAGMGAGPDETTRLHHGQLMLGSPRGGRPWPCQARRQPHREALPPVPTRTLAGPKAAAPLSNHDFVCVSTHSNYVASMAHDFSVAEVAPHLPSKLHMCN